MNQVTKLKRSNSLVAKKNKAGTPSRGKSEAKGPDNAPATVQTYTQQGSETASVEKIRDIIFGSQMQDYEQRFAHLEERLQKEIDDLQAEFSKRLESVENFIKKEIESMGMRLAAEADKHSEATRNISKEFSESVKSVSKTMERLDERQNKDSHDLRQQLQDQTKSLTDEIRRRQRESSETFQQSTQQLHDDKVGRSVLSKLLLEMAVRLSDELSAKLNLESEDFSDE